MDEARRRLVGVPMGLGLALGMALAPRPEALSVEAWHTAAVATLMAVWWLGDVLPRAVTALLPVVVLPLLGVAPMGELAGAYMHPLLLLMLGGFVLGHAMEVVGLHERLTATLLRPAWVRRGPRRILGALMLATALLSGIVSNTATMLMMLPLALALARVADPDGGARYAFALGLAWAASVGGLTTLVGTPPNAVLAGFAPDLVGVSVGFGQWMLYGVPMTLVLLPLAWWSVTRSFDVPARFPEALPPLPMPAARHGERLVVAVAAVAMLAWLARADKDLGVLVVPGWSRLVPGRGYELDAAVALLAALALFVLPGAADEEGRGRPLLDWRETERAIPWSVILLLGGGFALARAIASTGLTTWIAGGFVGLGDLPVPVTVLAICLVITFVTELTSNTATSQIVLPILAEAAPVVGISPMVWMAPAAISASCAFMMPVATAPNAIASESVGIPAGQMARAGLWMNLLGAVVVTGLSLLLVPRVFGP